MWCHWCVIYRVNLQTSVVYLWAPDLASFHNELHVQELKVVHGNLNRIKAVMYRVLNPVNVTADVIDHMPYNGKIWRFGPLIAKLKTAKFIYFMHTVKTILLLFILL